MEICKTIHDNGDIEIEYCDVNDDELITLVQNYPKLLDESNDICERYHELFQLNGLVLDDTAFDETPMR
jgi:hypothetical protein